MTRAAILGWGTACLLLAVAIVAEWQAFATVPAATGPVEPVADGPHAPANKPGPAGLGPLATYAAVTERPLFSPSRRPPPGSDGQAPAAIESSVTVAGIVMSGRERIALLRQNGERKLTSVHEGQVLGPWTVRSIAADRVILAGRDGDATLPLLHKQAAAKGAR